MGTSPALQARCSLLKVLITLSTSYAIVVNLNRASVDADVGRAFEKALLKVHPDKGAAGNTASSLRSVCQVILKNGGHAVMRLASDC